MNRHPLDLFSLITGTLFLVLGVLFMLDEQGVTNVDGRWVPASVLLAMGTAGIASSIRSDRVASTTDNDAPNTQVSD